MILSIDKYLKKVNSWQEFYDLASGMTNDLKGDIFDRLTQLVLLTRPEYKSKIKNVWRTKDSIPRRIREYVNYPINDEGIDQLVETNSGEFWAIQCKFKGQNQTPTAKEISTFTNLANVHCKNISLALLVHTSERGVKKRHLLGETYSELGLEFWLGLQAEDWKRIQYLLAGKASRLVPRKPRPHQEKAIEDAKSYFTSGKACRGKLIMPCGTGKSLTAFWIANELKARNVIVAVPSLSLIKQSLEDWTREFVALESKPRPDWLVICSDESAGKVEKDELVAEAYALGIPTTTNLVKIKDFLERKTKSNKVIFTTYQSSYRLAEAAKKSRFTFDLALFDEAHKTVGVKSKSFASLLSDKNISIDKRIFMTATERVVKGQNDEVYSMGDEGVYGKVFYQLSFKEAIQAKIICDYKILTIAVADTEIQELVRKNKIVTDRKHKLEEKEAQSLAAAIALRKACLNYNLSHSISFHRSIKVAEDFTLLNQQLNSFDKKGRMTSLHISSKQSAGERSRLMADFAIEPKVLMTNARCLTEGVDVPAIDCVVFADPKQSTIDIVQATGRALRPFKGKEYGYILLPIIVPEDVSIQEFTLSTRFKQVVRIITALSTQDERIVEEIRVTQNAGIPQSKKRILIDTDLAVGLSIDLVDFVSGIQSTIWKGIGRVNFRLFNEARNFVHSLGIQSETYWRIYCNSGAKPFDIPTNPKAVYKQDWKGFGDWLGTGVIAPRLRKYRTFTAAKLHVHELKLKKGSEWKEFCKTGNLPKDIPANPRAVYGQMWNGIGDWLGNGNPDPRLRKYFSFSEARIFVHQLKLKSYTEWREYSKSGDRPPMIPSSPVELYKREWKGWGDWLGTGKIGNQKRVYKSFNSARKLVHSLELKSVNEWQLFSTSGKRPTDIPGNPRKVYLNEWKGWGDWLGTGTISPSNKIYRPFKEAKEYVHSLALKSGYAWREFCKSGGKPSDIPASPEKTYKADWKGMGDWLGTGNVAARFRIYKPFNEAVEYVKHLKIKTVKEWNIYCKSELKPDDIPTDPHQVYKAKWKSWGDWLGSGAVAPRYKKYRPFNEAKKFIHSLKLGNQIDWKNYAQSEMRPADIPGSPWRTYKDEWISLGDWLGTGRIADALKVYRSFIEARKYVHSLNLSKGTEWYEYCLSGKKPNDIPANPKQTYKSEWKGIGDWFGTGSIANKDRNFKSFNAARKYVHSLHLKGQSEWRDYCVSGIKPIDIPTNPSRSYKTEWQGWNDWFGEKDIFVISP